MKKQGIYLILNNIRSAYNVGSIFRTADAVGVTKIYLCGITPTPGPIENDYPSSPSSSGSPSATRISKTALGAEKAVPWEYRKQTWKCLLELKNQSASRRTKIKIVALEQSPKSISLFKYKPPKNTVIALIVGNEVNGLNKKILSYADKIVEIPMHGKKESLNVSVATGIALYHLLNKQG